MIINAKSKISDIIREDPNAIEVIASINKHFKKLRNPLLRKILASRVNVQDAAKIGNVEPSVILLELQKIGFSIETNSARTKDEEALIFPSNSTNTNELMKSNEHSGVVITMDVRPILDGGEDPFNTIIKRLKELLPGQKLLIINSFEPVPLINLLKEKGYASETTRPVLGEVHTLFFKQTGLPDQTTAKSEIFKNDHALFESKLMDYNGVYKTIDVRDLEMPLPMVSILQEIEQLEIGQALLVEHKKFPQFLLEELSSRGYSMVSQELSAQHTRLLIYH